MTESPLDDVKAVEEVKINTAKASTKDLKNTPITPNNAQEITKELLKRDKKVQVYISSTERDKFAVPVGVNGRMFNIPRDTWVVVPSAVVKVLDNCIMTTYQTTDAKSGKDRGELSSAETKRFAVSVKPVEEPTPTPAPVRGK